MANLAGDGSDGGPSCAQHCVISGDEKHQEVVVELEIQEKPAEPKGCCGRKFCRHGPGPWCKKYFWEGQLLTADQDAKAVVEEGHDGPWYKLLLTRYRQVVGFLIPALIFHFFWWGFIIQYNGWYLFADKYYMTITMVFGSFIAGMTSEGGGAVAFPVMTLALGIDPSVARDFSLMIQSCGMTAAAFAIFFMRVRVEWYALILCTLGGVAGIIFGLHVVDPALPDPVKKMLFVSIWFAFCSVLVFLNRTYKRRTFEKIQNFNVWKGIVLFLTGCVGGIFTSFSGSGLDICSFSMLTLLFRVSEKVATPTSVILMSWCSLVGFYWRGVMMQAVSQDAWEYLAVCLPVVVFGAPIGSVLGSHFHRLVLAAFVIILDTVALVSAFAIVKPMTPALIGGSVGIIVGGIFIFLAITYAGKRLLSNVERQEQKAATSNGGISVEEVDGNETSSTVIHNGQRHNEQQHSIDGDSVGSQCPRGNATGQTGLSRRNITEFVVHDNEGFDEGFGDESSSTRF